MVHITGALKHGEGQDCHQACQSPDGRTWHDVQDASEGRQGGNEGETDRTGGDGCASGSPGDVYPPTADSDTQEAAIRKEVVGGQADGGLGGATCAVDQEGNIEENGDT